MPLVEAGLIRLDSLLIVVYPVVAGTTEEEILLAGPATHPVQRLQSRPETHNRSNSIFYFDIHTVIIITIDRVSTSTSIQIVNDRT